MTRVRRRDRGYFAKTQVHGRPSVLARTLNLDLHASSSHGTPHLAVYVAGVPPKECNLNFSSSTIVLLLAGVYQKWRFLLMAKIAWSVSQL